MSAAHLRATDDVLLAVEDLVVEFPERGGARVQAVSGVSFDLVAGETLGLVGESGCGKSTVGRAVLQLPPPTAGRVVFDGTELTALRGDALRRVRPRLQMVFQDPIASLNPRRRVGDLVVENLTTWQPGTRHERAARARELLEAVGLDAELADRRPHELSGGQAQRVCIARAVATGPELVICDEPVSALDVSVQAQILNLLQDLRDRDALTLLFISHDLAVVKVVSDRVAVMYLGRLCELAPPEALYERPAHPYTEALLAANPEPDPALRSGELGVVRGEVPSPVSPPSGCRFRTRCPRVAERCATEQPELRAVGSAHWVACHHPLHGDTADHAT